jgi:hypothetical protein
VIDCIQVGTHMRMIIYGWIHINYSCVVSVYVALGPYWLLIRVISDLYVKTPIFVQYILQVPLFSILVHVQMGFCVFMCLFILYEILYLLAYSASIIAVHLLIVDIYGLIYIWVLHYFYPYYWHCSTGRSQCRNGYLYP